MNFSLIYEKRFIRDLVNIPVDERRMLKRRLEWLAENVYNIRHYNLRGMEFKEMYRFRIANWRIFYRIDFNSEKIIVLSLKDRKDAYR
ncbi:type II toxin-antitoxin system RelE/ParE family toxin [bacterium]|nr:type II toxin-antitoxin system RelE/ParE family toxin [FCB group bacterium]MBL7192250.1 type II toxin-antitoxin system RelE/ParE family toxin [bacterium]